jgi:hypothetical protein
MIYSRFGTKLTPISKEQDASGRISLQATAEGADDIRNYAMNELKADDGMTEINETLGILPWRVVERPTQGGRRRPPPSRSSSSQT